MSTGSTEAMAFRRGPCMNALALLRALTDGCEERRVRISGMDIEGTSEEPGSDVFRRLRAGLGGAVRMPDVDTDARTSNWREIYAKEFIEHKCNAMVDAIAPVSDDTAFISSKVLRLQQK